MTSGGGVKYKGSIDCGVQILKGTYALLYWWLWDLTIANRRLNMARYLVFFLGSQSLVLRGKTICFKIAKISPVSVSHPVASVNLD